MDRSHRALRFYFLLSGLLLAAWVPGTAPLHGQASPADYVNVFSGTSNSRWMLFPGPSMPFGMVKLSPDNQLNVWNGGYEYTVGSISGFSHLHGFGLAGVSYMPYVGKLDFGDEYLRLFPGSPDGPFGSMWTAGYRSRYHKDTETGRPGYYAVDLIDTPVRVELTATARCGLIRTTFPAGGQARLLLDFDPPTEERSQILEARVMRVSDHEIAGYIAFRNTYVDSTTVHFVTRFDAPLTGLTGWQYSPYAGDPAAGYGTDWRREVRLSEDVDRFSGGASSGVILNFATEGQQAVVAATGLSFVSIDNARLNLEAELGPLGYDFDRVAAAGLDQWNELLTGVTVRGREEDQQKFYTNYYRSFTGKVLMSDANGEYMDLCERVRTVQSPAGAVYSSDALWGTQWTLTPFWTLAAPDYANRFANSLLELQGRGGWIPEAPVGLEYSPVMGAQHQNALLISLYQKGLHQFDPDSVLRMIEHDYTRPPLEHPCGGLAGNYHNRAYLEYGYVTEESGGASNTMEYAFDDWCLAQLAKALDAPATYATFMARADNWRNHWDAGTGYLRRRHADGSWYSPFDPYRYGTEGSWQGAGYMEGNAWIYTWYVPHDLPGLIDLLGRDTFVQRLEEGFREGHVDLSNQPNLQAPFLFNYAGRPDLTQRYSRMVADSFFHNSPLRAYVGEEDEGQMGALYCLLGMGLFEMQAGCSTEPYYDLSSPVFDEVRIRRPGGAFTIIVENNSPENVYIQSAELNGTALSTPRLAWSDIVAGGKLVLRMGARPVPWSK